MQHEVAKIGTPPFKQRAPFSKSKIYREVKAGRFPPPVFPGYWLISDLDRWLEDQSGFARRAG
jgi:predicted DNA-binding transcriptional regulator AlpA